MRPVPGISKAAKFGMGMTLRDQLLDQIWEDRNLTLRAMPSAAR